MTAVTFPDAKAFRAWLKAHHATETELVVRLYKVHAADRGLTYSAALDEALCYGWIDAVRRGVDEDSFSIRFTPRKPRSIWSNVNLAHVARLTAAKKMTPAGIAAFEARTPERTGIYSFELEPAVFPAEMLKRFKANRAAWKFFSTQPPWYQRKLTHRVVRAKRADTQERRFIQLVTASEAGKRLD
jgi:uncharacterized protein YdeI (YjbR/CyaY-like superfamily)